MVQTVTVWFPKDVRADKVEIDGDPRLEAAWIADGVRKAAGKSEGGRVPVAVQTVFIQDGQTRTDEAVYNLAYSLHHRLLQPDRVKLEGLSLARRGFKGDPQAAADKLWGKRSLLLPRSEAVGEGDRRMAVEGASASRVAFGGFAVDDG